MKKVIYSAMLAGGILLGGVPSINVGALDSTTDEINFGEGGFGADIQLFGQQGLLTAMALSSNLSPGTTLAVTFDQYDTNNIAFDGFLSLGAGQGLELGLFGNNDFLNNGITFDGEGEDEIIVTGTRNGDPWTTSVYPDALAMLGITIDEYLFGPQHNIAEGVTNIHIGGGSSSSDDDSDDDEDTTDIPTDVVPERPTGYISRGAAEQFQDGCRRQPGCSYTITIKGRVHPA